MPQPNISPRKLVSVVLAARNRLKDRLGELRIDHLVGVYRKHPIALGERKRTRLLRDKAGPIGFDYLGPRRSGQRRRAVVAPTVEHQNFVTKAKGTKATTDPAGFVAGDDDGGKQRQSEGAGRATFRSMSDIQTRFSDSYDQARSRFRAAVGGHEHGAIEVHDGLTVDWAWVGQPNARRVRVYSSGLHGIEGFGGGAAQVEALSLPDDGVATFYLHGLNPYGWANLRRVNENNVDLNRNFLAPNQPYSGAPEAYTALNALLNPPTAPGGFDSFWLQAAWSVAKHGYQAMKNAVVGGQYDYDKGLFYGGSQLQPGPAQFLPFMVQRLAQADRVVHVDWHSALGAYGDRTMLLEGQVPAPELARVKRVMGNGLRTWDPNDSSAYIIRGGMTAELMRQLSGVRYDGLTCEFGTQANLRVLAALRNENRLHHWGESRLDHPAKLAMRAAFAPLDPVWQRAVLVHAREVHQLCKTLLESELESE